MTEHLQRAIRAAQEEYVYILNDSEWEAAIQAAVRELLEGMTIPFSQARGRPASMGWNSAIVEMRHRAGLENEHD